MRIPILLLCITAAVPTLHAQVGAPPLADGAAAREATLSLLPSRNPGSLLDAGVAATFRRTDGIDLAVRLVQWRGVDQRTSAEVGSFGALPGFAGVRAAWSAGVGVESGRRGVFLPFGVDLARDLTLGGRRATPFLHLGASLDGIDPAGGHAGDLAPVAAIGADLRMRPRWSLRAALASTDGGGFSIGMAYAP